MLLALALLITSSTASSSSPSAASQKAQWAPTGPCAPLHARAVSSSETSAAARPCAGERPASVVGRKDYAAGNPPLNVDPDGRIPPLDTPVPPKPSLPPGRPIAWPPMPGNTPKPSGGIPEEPGNPRMIGSPPAFPYLVVGYEAWKFLQSHPNEVKTGLERVARFTELRRDPGAGIPEWSEQPRANGSPSYLHSAGEPGIPITNPSGSSQQPMQDEMNEPALLPGDPTSDQRGPAEDPPPTVWWQDPQENPDHTMLLGKLERVYVHYKNGKVVYIGITDNMARRAKEHAADPDKTGETMVPVTDWISHDKARTIEGMLIRERLQDARLKGLLKEGDSIEEQLKKAGLDNRNRGRISKNWLDNIYTPETEEQENPPESYKLKKP